jgi:hypothetical protein
MLHALFGCVGRSSRLHAHAAQPDSHEIPKDAGSNPIVSSDYEARRVNRRAIPRVTLMQLHNDVTSRNRAAWERIPSPDVESLNDIWCEMLASPIPIYLGCAGLLVGSLGLGAQYLIGGNSVTKSDPAPTQPLFVQSIDAVPMTSQQWLSREHTVAFYGPMIDLMTTAAVASRHAATSAQSSTPQSDTAQEAQVSAPRETLRERSRQTKPSSRRAKARTREETMAAEPDPREARAQADAEEVVHWERHYRSRDDVEAVDHRSRGRDTQRHRPRNSRERAPVEEDLRDSMPRVFRVPAPDHAGFNPPGLFGGMFEPD